MRTYLLGIALVAAAPVPAAIVIDQQQSAVTSYNIDYLYDETNIPGTFVAQSFQQASQNIAGVGLYLYAGSSVSQTLTITVWNKLPKDATAVALATSSLTSTFSTGWVDLMFNPVAIAANTTYYITAKSSLASPQLAVAGAFDYPTSNAYSRGQVYTRSGYSNGSGGWAYADNSLASLDWAFRTYQDTTFSPASSVPEASIWVTMIAGFAMVGCGMRFRSTARALTADAHNRRSHRFST